MNTLKKFTQIRESKQIVREIISRLNFSVWNQNQYQLLSDNNIARKLSHLILSAGNVLGTAEVKVNKFINSSGDLFVFYQTAEIPSEAPERESRPLLCSQTQCSGPISLSSEISARTEPNCLVSPARRPLERASRQLSPCSQPGEHEPTVVSLQPAQPCQSPPFTPTMIQGYNLESL